MADQLQKAHDRLNRIVRAIDKRVIVFEYIGDSILAPDEIPALFGIDGGEWAHLSADKQAFKDFFLQKTTQTDSPGSGVLLIMDMDNFKKVNDMLGHPVGDKVLKQFAELLQDFFEGRPCVTGRLGGDEFVAFLNGDIAVHDLEEMLAGFIANVKKTFAGEYPEQKLSSSIGAAFVGPDTSDYPRLYKHADTALYNVKENGKGNYLINLQ